MIDDVCIKFVIMINGLLSVLSLFGGNILMCSKLFFFVIYVLII